MRLRGIDRFLAGRLCSAVSAVIAVVGAASAAYSANASRDAAGTMANAANQISEAQRAAGQTAFNNDMSAIPGINALYKGYSQMGNQYAGQLSSQMGNLTKGFNPTQAQLAAMPGYQFTMQQGLEATQNGFAAQGLGVSGAAMKGAGDYAAGLANQNYLNDANVFYQNQNNAYNKLMGGATLGMDATNSMANNRINLTTAANSSLTGQTNQAANTSMIGAQAQAAGQVGAANAYTNALNTGANAYTTYKGAQAGGGY